MDAEVSTYTFLTMIIEEYVCFMSCEPLHYNNGEDDKHAHGFADFYFDLKHA
jgi:hypothetical protein